MKKKKDNEKRITVLIGKLKQGLIQVSTGNSLDQVVRNSWEFMSIFPVLSSVCHGLIIDKQKLLLL